MLNLNNTTKIFLTFLTTLTNTNPTKKVTTVCSHKRYDQTIADNKHRQRNTLKEGLNQAESLRSLIDFPYL